MIESKIVKVSICAPKIAGLEGFDSLGPVRNKAAGAISSFLDSLIQEDKIVIGITSLEIGLSQDFAKLCRDKDLDYYYYSFYETSRSQWKKINHVVVNQTQELIDSSTKVVENYKGGFSPKKYIKNQIRMYKDSDIIIYVSGFLPIKNPGILDCLDSKPTYVIPLYA